MPGWQSCDPLVARDVLYIAPLYVRVSYCIDIDTLWPIVTAAIPSHFRVDVG
jgi:hypothetical protein